MEGIKQIYILQIIFLMYVNGQQYMSCCWNPDGCIYKPTARTYTSGANLIVLDWNRMYMINLNETTITKLVVNMQTRNRYSLKIDYHQIKPYIYWVDSYYGSIHRTCYPCYNDERKVEEVISSSSLLYHPFSLAIDSDHDHIYWSDSSFKAIIRSELDGSNKIAILNRTAGIGHIALDSTNSWIYFMDDKIGSIDRCRLDGKEQTTIKSDSMLTTNSRIVLDLLVRRIFWTVGNTVRSATFEGNDFKEFQGYSNRYSWSSLVDMDVHGENLYYVDNVFREMRKVNRTGHFRDTYMAAAHVYSSMLGIKTYNGKVFKDPCNTHRSLNNAEKRSNEFYASWTADDTISDEMLDEDWYRIVSDNGDGMPTSPPGLNFCGTVNPIWLNGTLPSFVDGNMTAIACMQTNNSVCEHTFNIEIRDCDGYYVYYLLPSPPNASYCFGSGPVKCPSDMSSETENYPGCSSYFPNDKIPVEVKAVLAKGESFQRKNYYPTPSLIPIFKCEFEDKSNGTYGYDVYWYICGKIVKNMTNLLFKDIDDAVVLEETDWLGTYKMNMQIRCAVRIRNSVLSTPGPFMYSVLFEAGLFPSAYYYTVIEGESIDITFTSTVPVGCNVSHNITRSQCDQNFFIFRPSYYAYKSSCTNDVMKRDILFKADFCGIKLGNLDWMEKKTLQVYGYNDGLYNANTRYAYIKLLIPSISTYNDIWTDVDIRQIRVQVIDKDSTLKNRLCQSYNDPHFRTFDGNYYDYMGVGEFVMYKNDIGPFRVHALFTSCSSSMPGTSCICGIAVRSKDSLFVLRTCEKISRKERHLLQQPVVTLTSCNKNDMSIDHTNNNYKIILPIATEIRFSIARRFISVISIKPSVKDINTAKGLCGVPSTTKDPSDDFTHRENGPISDEQIFADSWRITQGMAEEQLFVEEPEFFKKINDLNDRNVVVDKNENNTNARTFCACEQQASSSDSLNEFNNRHCNLTDSTEQCTGSQSSSGKNMQYESCYQSVIKRRSVHFSNQINKQSISDNDDLVDFQPLSYSDNVTNTETEASDTFRNGWTTERAYNTCFDSISKALKDDLYKDYVVVPVEKFIEACVKDIELAGDTTFLTDTINAMVTSIMTELVKTEELYTTKSSDGSQTLLEYFASGLCLNNCSDHGICESGVCRCNNGYIGEDCSYNTSYPPTEISFPFYGLCKLRTRACKATNVFGEFHSTFIWGKRRHFQILQNDLLETPDEDIVLAEYRNSFMVTIDLPTSEKKRSTESKVIAEGYDISFSYDDQHFGKEISLIIYDDLQYSCNATTKTCISLIAEDSSQEVENKKNIIMIVVQATVSVVVIILIIGIICFKMMVKSSKSKIAAYRDEPDQKTTTCISENCMERENTVSELDFHFVENRVVDVFAMHYPQQKDHVNVWNGGFKTSK